MAQVDFDHTAFAVHDALAHATALRAHFGAVPILGETVAAFRYLTMYVGSATRGTGIEFLEPTGDGFLSGYLRKRGEGPHHMTFAVPNVRKLVAAVREQGFGVVDENYDDPAWQEAFIRPDATHGTIIQLATSDRQYPPADQLLTTTSRDALAMPHLPGATDRDWWTALWDTQPGNIRHVGPTVLRSTDMQKSQVLFGSLLQGQAHKSLVEGGVRYSWPSGTVEVVPGQIPGIAGITVDEFSEELVDFGLAAPRDDEH